MAKHLILNKTTNTQNYFTIEEIITIIKANPTHTYYKFINGEQILINNRIVCETLFIAHRINKLEELETINEIFGVELDLRDDYLNNKIIISHDPFIQGEDFETYLSKYNGQTIILNIKSERIEIKCLELMEKYNIKNYFFLDSSFPMIYLLNTKYLNNNIACRFSEYEPIEFYLSNHKMTNWIWVDCFTIQPLTYKIYNEIKELNGKICIVSPELQSQSDKIYEYRNYFINNDIIPNAICCKIYNIIKWI
jgi:hypothetical protein